MNYSKEEIAVLKEEAKSLICPHFANNDDLAKTPKIFSGGDGCYVFDIEGNKYLDTFASLMTTICGHNCGKIITAVCEQVKQLEFFPNYYDTFSLEQIKLAKKLKEICPGDLSVSFFVNSGSEAMETALKMARQYHVNTGNPQKYKIIGRIGSYHGTTLGTTAATGLDWFKEHYVPMLGNGFFQAIPARCYDCKLNKETCGLACFKDIKNIVEREGAETVAAIIMDPIPGSNTGYPIPPDGYLQRVRELCDKYNILLIFDEIQTGFGKTGKMFACEHFGVTPDIMGLGKGITGGYIPLGAAVTTPKIYAAFADKPGNEFRSGSTYGGHNVVCAAALAAIDFIQENDLISKAGSMGLYVNEKLDELKRKYPIVGDHHGLGMLKAVELHADKSLNIGTFIRDFCYERGMILRNNGDILVIAPALIITKEQIDFMTDLIEQAIVSAMRR